MRWLVGVLLATTLAGCGGLLPGNSTGNQRELRELIQEGVPGVRVTGIESRDGYNGTVGIALIVEGPRADAPEIHRTTRAVARLAWLRAPQRIGELQVEQRVPRTPGACATERPIETAPDCWRDALVIGTRDAVELWGRPDDVDRPGGGDTGPCTDIAGRTFGGDVTLLSVTRPADPPAFEVRADEPPPDPRALADRAAGHLWGCQPQRLDGLVLEVAAGPGRPLGEFRYTASQLRAQFGDRPQDLPQ